MRTNADPVSQWWRLEDVDGIVGGGHLIGIGCLSVASDPNNGQRIDSRFTLIIFITFKLL